MSSKELKAMHKKIEVPNDIWCDFMNVLYSAVQHIKPTEENVNCLNFIRNQIQESIEKQDVLVVDGKIVDKDKFIKGILDAKQERKTVLSN